MADEEDTLKETPEDEVATDAADVAPSAPGGILEDVDIEEEMSRDYIDYSMSVIIGRALPDVRDGLKPVHRRCLYSMYMLDNVWNKKHLKSANTIRTATLPCMTPSSAWRRTSRCAFRWWTATATSVR